MATGHLPEDAEPGAMLPAQTSPDLVAEYMTWMKQHPDLEAGSVPAERILRQRAREARSI